MKKIFFLFLLIILASSLSSAQILSCAVIPPVKAGECLQLIQTCPDCTFVNITAIHFPNSSSIYLNEAMTKNVNTYNYTFCDTELRGQYVYDTFGNPGGQLATESVCFLSTPTGVIIGLPQAIFFLIFIVFMFVILIVLMRKVYQSETPGSRVSYFLTGYFVWLIIVFAIYRLVADFLWEMPYLADIFLYALIISIIITFPLIGLCVVYLVNQYMKSVAEDSLRKRGHSDDSIRTRMRSN